jgi:hypothetical protein
MNSHLQPLRLSACRSTLKRISSAQSEEVLVPDSRTGLRPADMVERKLIYALAGTPFLVSHMRADVPRDRGRSNSCSR